MAKGGRRNRSGPLPDMQALVRNRDIKTFTRLPRECTREAPDWPPYMSEPSQEELTFWDELWSSPQAHIWHADHLEAQVASYVRIFIESAKPRASAVNRAEARQRGVNLYLDSEALARGRYVIVDSPEDEILTAIQETMGAADTGTAGPSRGPARPGRSARDRMTVVQLPVRDEADNA